MMSHFATRNCCRKMSWSLAFSHIPMASMILVAPFVARTEAAPYEGSRMLQEKPCEDSDSIALLLSVCVASIVFSAVISSAVVRKKFQGRIRELANENRSTLGRVNHAEAEVTHLKNLIRKQIREADEKAVRNFGKTMRDKRELQRVSKSLENANKIVAKCMNEGGSALESWKLNFNALEFVRPIGEGASAFGTVYLGNVLRAKSRSKHSRTLSKVKPMSEMDKETDLKGESLIKKPVAIKTIRHTRVSEEVINKFLRETSIMCALRHPNIVNLYGVVINEQDGPDRLCLVIEYCPNGSLLDHLTNKDAKYTWEGFYHTIAQDIARCFVYLHHEQPNDPLIHRDLKPANVLLTDENSGKVADFGEATRFSEARAGERNVDQAMDSDVLTMTMVGTPMYCAPEILLNEAYNESVDVYSFAVVMLEMASCEHDIIRRQFQFVMHGSSATTRGWRPKPSKWLKNTHAGLVDLVREMWRGKPEDRPSFVEILERLEVLGSPSTHPESSTSLSESEFEVEEPDSESSPQFNAEGYGVMELQTIIRERDAALAQLRSELASLRIAQSESRKAVDACKCQEAFLDAIASMFNLQKSRDLDAVGAVVESDGGLSQFVCSGGVVHPRRKPSRRESSPSIFQSFFRRKSVSSTLPRSQTQSTIDDLALRPTHDGEWDE